MTTPTPSKRSDTQDAQHVPLTRAQRLAQDAAEAADVRAYQTHPDVVALRVERVRAQVDRLCWAGIVLGLAFTMTNVQTFAAGGARPWSLPWLAAWVLDPTVSLVLLAILRGEQVTARYQVHTGPWVRVAKWFTLAATYLMNTWASYADGSPSRIVLHSVPPLLVFVAAEAITDLRDKLTEAVTVAFTEARARVHEPQQRSRRKAFDEYLVEARAAWSPGVVVTPAWAKSRRQFEQAVKDLAVAVLRSPWRYLGAVVRGIVTASRWWRRWVTVRDFRDAAELSEKLADKFTEIRALTLFRWKVTGAVTVTAALGVAVAQLAYGNQALWITGVATSIALAMLGRRKDGSPGRKAVLAGPRTLTWTMDPQVLVDAFRDAKLIGKDETLRLVERAHRQGEGWAIVVDRRPRAATPARPRRSTRPRPARTGHHRMPVHTHQQPPRQTPGSAVSPPPATPPQPAAHATTNVGTCRSRRTQPRRSPSPRPVPPTPPAATHARSPRPGTHWSTSARRKRTATQHSHLLETLTVHHATDPPPPPRNRHQSTPPSELPSRPRRGSVNFSV